MEPVATSPQATYHQATLDLLGREYIFHASPTIDDVSVRYSLQIPPSVREWYALSGAIDLLVYTRVFDFQYLIGAWKEDAQGEEERFIDGPAPVGDLRNWLEQRFEKEPVTCDASYSVQRFSRQAKQQRIVVYEKNGAAQWVLTAATVQDRRQLITDVSAML